MKKSRIYGKKNFTFMEDDMGAMGKNHEKIVEYDKFVIYCYTSGRVCTASQIHMAYLITDRWRELQQARLKVDGYRCRMCGERATCVHHIVYPDILGTESLDDLTSLCHRCHTNYHKPPSIDDLREQTLQKASVGDTKCPLCNTKLKVYKRKFNAGMAVTIIRLYHLTASNVDDWLVISQKTVGKALYLDLHHGEYPKLKYWGLIEQKPKDKGKPASGHWRLTQKGKAFVRREIKIESHVYELKGEAWGFSDVFIDIGQALGKKFIYSELMQPAYCET